MDLSTIQGDLVSLEKEKGWIVLEYDDTMLKTIRQGEKSYDEMYKYLSMVRLFIWNEKGIRKWMRWIPKDAPREDRTWIEDESLLSLKELANVSEETRASDKKELGEWVGWKEKKRKPRARPLRVPPPKPCDTPFSSKEGQSPLANKKDKAVPPREVSSSSPVPLVRIRRISSEKEEGSPSSRRVPPKKPLPRVPDKEEPVSMGSGSIDSDFMDSDSEDGQEDGRKRELGIAFHLAAVSAAGKSRARSATVTTYKERPLPQPPRPRQAPPKPPPKNSSRPLCAVCHHRFSGEREKCIDIGQGGHGTVHVGQSVYGGSEQRRWTCCGGHYTSVGCVSRGPHIDYNSIEQSFPFRCAHCRDTVGEQGTCVFHPGPFHWNHSPASGPCAEASGYGPSFGYTCKGCHMPLRGKWFGVLGLRARRPHYACCGKGKNEPGCVRGYHVRRGWWTRASWLTVSERTQIEDAMVQHVMLLSQRWSVASIASSSEGDGGEMEIPLGGMDGAAPRPVRGSELPDEVERRGQAEVLWLERIIAQHLREDVIQAAPPYLVVDLFLLLVRALEAQAFGTTWRYRNSGKAVLEQRTVAIQEDVVGAPCSEEETIDAINALRLRAFSDGRIGQCAMLLHDAGRTLLFPDHGTDERVCMRPVDRGDLGLAALVQHIGTKPPRAGDWFLYHAKQPFGTQAGKEVVLARVEAVAKSAARPVILSLRGFDGPTGVLERIPPALLVKHGDDVGHDAAALCMFRAFSAIWACDWGQDHWWCGLVPPPSAEVYQVAATGRMSGVIEIVPNCRSMDGFKWDQFDLSCPYLLSTMAGGYMAAYVLGIKDRHFENILLQIEPQRVPPRVRRLLHIDFGWMLGDHPAVDTADISIPKSMQAALGKTSWTSFVSMCTRAHTLLRHRSGMILEMARLLFGEGPTGEKAQNCLKRTLALDPDPGDEAAGRHIEEVVEAAPGHWQTEAKRITHNVAGLFK